MSFDVFVHYFENGENGQVPISRIREVFAVSAERIEEETDTVWEVIFKTGSSTLYFGNMDDAGNVNGFMVHRPCVDETLWFCMYECLSLGNGVIIIPGFDGMISNQSEVRAHLLEDMIEGIGEVKVVKDKQEFLEVLKK